MHLLPAEQIQAITTKYRGAFVFVIILIIAALIAFVVIKIVRALKKPTNASYVANAPVPVGWDPTATTDGIYRAIDGTFVSAGTQDDSYKAFNDINDNQMVSVYNDWLKRYYNNKKFYLYPYGTLTNAIKNKWGYVSLTGTNQKDVAEGNLDRLQLK